MKAQAVYAVFRNAPVVADQPQVRLTKWMVRRDRDGNCYFVGFLDGTNTGRVSTPVIDYDPETRRGRTTSGRSYELVGPPGHGPGTEAVWQLYRWSHGIAEAEVRPS